MNKPGMMYCRLVGVAEALAPVIPPLVLRLVLAWEFWEAGLEKLHGTNWFVDVPFPFPFSLLPPEVSWNMAMMFELAGAVALVLGLATRFFSASLMVLTVVAIAAVHWPEQWNTLAELLRGYRISDPEGDGFGNFKLPVLYLVMLLPLLLGGGGKLSLDAWFGRYCHRSCHRT